LLKTKLSLFVLENNFSTNFIFCVSLARLAKLILYSFGQRIEFFCDLTNELCSCFELVLSLPVIIVTLGCSGLACLFEKAGVMTLCLLSLLHYYMQQNMQNNIPCALV